VLGAQTRLRGKNEKGKRNNKRRDQTEKFFPNESPRDKTTNSKSGAKGKEKAKQSRGLIHLARNWHGPLVQVKKACFINEKQGTSQLGNKKNGGRDCAGEESVPLRPTRI